ncbi:hypothetical protein SAMN04489726_7290 [Allokutzneria albata]|uniref:Uncharacterized protein n=1 Tax=Allokutzneria albata TaxID=211114 RepID=A0A1H0CL34_ALLAB|nr:hypothetical protein SAMN04489726_7290 [Allokutzneria albata]
MDAFSYAPLSADDRLVYCPFKPVSAHTFVAVQSRDLGKLAKGDLVPVAVEIDEVVVTELIE